MIQSLIIILAIVVLWTLTYIQDWKSVIGFLTILFTTYYLFNIENEYICFGLAGIVACILHVNFTNIESFKLDEKVKEKKENKDNTKDDDDEEDDDDEDIDDIDDIDDEIEDYDDNSNKTDTDTSFTNSDKNPIDMTETIKTALSNFDPKTLENMTNDTTKLIKSQSELMNVIEQMQPVISKGMALVDKFQGSGKTEELFKKFHAMSKNR